MTESSEAQAISNIDFTPDNTERLEMAIRVVQQGLKTVEVIYSSHPRWPLPAQKLPRLSTSASSNVDTRTDLTEILHGRRSLHISVLDSSFNPPTLAHLALARSKPPISSFSQGAALIQNRAQRDTSDSLLTDRDYDARLLLLSVRNADKALKPGDATFSQRLEMMTHLAHELEQSADMRPFQSSSSAASPDTARRHDVLMGNVAVAIIDEPTFVRKSSVLREYLRGRLASLFQASDGALPADDLPVRTVEIIPDVRLTFLMGFDTLERFLSLRYYGGTNDSMHNALKIFFSSPPNGDGSEIVCAWRGSAKSETSTELARQRVDSLAESETEAEKIVRETMQLAKPFVKSGGIAFIHLTDWEMQLSSSEVRSRCAARDNGWRQMVLNSVEGYIEKHQLYHQ